MTTSELAKGLTDDGLREMWRNAGGDFYGPHVETGKMPESLLLPFLRNLLALSANKGERVEPVAWLKEWENQGPCSRLDFKPDVEPWLREFAPKITPLYTHPPADSEYRRGGMADVAAERERQISVEGWTPEHDDEHIGRELAIVAACYVEHYVERAWVIESLRAADYQDEQLPDNWPPDWAERWWKPRNPRRDLVRAAALIVAEIERLDRALIPAQRQEGGG